LRKKLLTRVEKRFILLVKLIEKNNQKGGKSHENHE